MEKFRYWDAYCYLNSNCKVYRVYRRTVYKGMTEEEFEALMRWHRYTKALSRGKNGNVYLTQLVHERRVMVPRRK